MLMLILSESTLRHLVSHYITHSLFYSYLFIIIRSFFYFFFFSSRRRHTRWTGDWSSDVCSSDLLRTGPEPYGGGGPVHVGAAIQVKIDLVPIDPQELGPGHGFGSGQAGHDAILPINSDVGHRVGPIGRTRDRAAAGAGHAGPPKPSYPGANVPGMRIVDLPLSDRPRERLARHGAGALADRELLAIILGTGGSPGAGAHDLAERLLARFGSMAALSRAHPADLAAVAGIGR